MMYDIQGGCKQISNANPEKKTCSLQKLHFLTQHKLILQNLKELRLSGHTWDSSKSDMKGSL